MSDEPVSAPRWSPATRAVSEGRPAAHPGAAVNEPVTLSATFHAGGTTAYGREGNPTWSALETTLASLESATGAVAFGSGMAAINAVLDLVPMGGAVVAPSQPYSGTRGRLTELADSGRITMRWYSAAPDANLVDALDGAHLLWIETPTNPMLQISDIAELARQGHAAGAIVAVDSTFATPIQAQPLTLGADLVVHSATKYLAGHSDVLMGLVAANDPQLLDRLRERRALLGSIPGPFEAWLTLRGIRTLAVRMERAVANATAIAQRLTEHPAIEQVLYPGLSSHPGHALAMSTSGAGAIVCFVMASGERAEAVCSATTLWTHGTSLGGVESLIERRARWWFEHPDVPAGLVRLSVGIEDVDDLWTDLLAALDG